MLKQLGKLTDYIGHYNSCLNIVLCYLHKF